MSDDGSMRRSRRAPVPKRSFDLIDKFETKGNPLKKKQKPPTSEETKTCNRPVKRDIQSKADEEDCDGDDSEPSQGLRFFISVKTYLKKDSKRRSAVVIL